MQFLDDAANKLQDTWNKLQDYYRPLGSEPVSTKANDIPAIPAADTVSMAEQYKQRVYPTKML